MNYYERLCSWFIKATTMAPLITLDKISKVARSIKGVRGQLIVDALNNILPKYGMYQVDIFEEFLPILFVESKELNVFEENLNYSVKGLRTTFGLHRITVAQCEAYGRIDGKRAANKRAIANTVYGGQWGKVNLGNIKPNDGYDLRGSGAIQGTGRDILNKFRIYIAKEFNMVLTVEEIAIKLRQLWEIEFNIHFACWVFAIYKGLIDEAINDYFTKIMIGINGGLNGKEEREQYYKLTKQIFR